MLSRNMIFRLAASMSVLAFLALLAGGCATSQPREDETDMKPPVQTAKNFKYSRSQQEEIDYLLYLPKGYKSKEGQRWPLIFFLHGAGERGTNAWKVATHGPPRQATNNFDLPFVVVSPQCKQGRVWSNDILLALLNEVLRTHRIDESRVYLTGLSMGGYGTWNLGLAHPEKFAAIAPICGGGDIIGPLLSSREKASYLQSLGVWAFHGAKDNVVPLSESERMVDVVKRSGVKDVKLTIYPQAGHDSWTETYQNPEFYKWLLQHSR